MRIGNIIITNKTENQRSIDKATKSATSGLTKKNNELEEKLNGLKHYIADELGKFHKKQEKEAIPDIHVLNKNLKPWGIPYQEYIVNGKRDVYKMKDLDTLKFWSDELPQAPQSITYLVQSMFARGYHIEVREGKTENKELKARIDKIFKRANKNGTPLIEVIKTALRHTYQVGNGYIEKLQARGGDFTAGFINVQPWNIIPVVDKEKEKMGILDIKYYVKIDKITDDFDGQKVKPKDRVRLDDIIHIKYIDEGQKYGQAAWQKNQEFTKMIMNVMNRNQKKFTNDLRHSLLIKLGKKATRIDADLFLAQYKSNYLGKNNYGKPLIVYGGIEVERWELEDKDFDYQEFMQKLGINHAPSMLNIAPSEILNNDAKYSNSSQGHISTIINTVYDWQNKTESIFNDDILPSIEGLDPLSGELSTYIIKLERENINTMYDHADELNKSIAVGAISVNEWRKVVDPKNLPPIEEEWADKHFIIVGKQIVFLDQEYFGGTDEAELSYQDGSRIINMNSFFEENVKPKRAKKTRKK